jgi:DNA-binding NtrC family response regulator
LEEESIDSDTYVNNSSDNNLGANSISSENPKPELPINLYKLIEPLLKFPDGGVNLNLLMKEYETLLIEAALSRAGGFKNNAAKLLNINRTTLQEKLRKK